eukprot:scaffold206129_cov36-Tisochrysis_lutea.AAC.1
MRRAAPLPTAKRGARDRLRGRPASRCPRQRWGTQGRSCPEPQGARCRKSPQHDHRQGLLPRIGRRGRMGRFRA